jgi:hypothetical protein
LGFAPQLKRNPLGACMTQVRSSLIIRSLYIGLPASLVVAATLFYRVFAPNCDSTMVAEFPALHRPLKASVSVRKCRVSQQFSTRVSLVDADQAQLPDSPNVMTVWGDTLFGRSLGGPEVAVIWANDSTLVVRYDTTRRANRSADHLAGVAIHFENLP